ncbi:GMC family oxidoreductase [Aestuariirhabdus litorea]|uniref:GMC family oxidoreductase n=1 Tax=Aestuariirhabdus litorea TaxID=2528527 RepID=A0A3P3VLC1_9GAMM|nr:GMC family oxidoreductase [Aestuariirhabdus litorea]RRJ82678.1 GMC family oxidoreductase [Aestuariirhabdus litorea]RWW92838.1 GMC family oxidoreductase [Endozoicomonadaceae bacterium GTF-13]
MAIDDPIRRGIESGWKVHKGALFEQDHSFETDVVIIGSGAGGGTSAEILARAGLRVLIVEEGLLRSSNDFNMDEQTAYADLYQEGSARTTKDGGITILQGRAVGGTTVVNWTSSFRTPAPTLEHWRDHYGIDGFEPEAMAPWFERMEQRLGIEQWAMPPNENNDLLRRGCEALNYSSAIIPRNVRGCWNLGYCGTGCPTNAKQSMLVTTIPAALEQGAELLYLARAQYLRWEGERVTELVCSAMDSRCAKPTGVTLRIRARHFLLAAGAIGSPALLIRSNVPNPSSLLGRRTFLHPVSFSYAQMPDPVEGYYGAPQSVYSDHFQWDQGVTGPLSYKLEVPPLQPALTAALFKTTGDSLHQVMEALPNTHVMLALMRDGFHPLSQGGNVQLRNDGTPVLDYPLTDYLWDGLRRSLHSMAEIQFAAGAQRVRPSHQDSQYFDSLSKVREQIDRLPMQAYRMMVGSAHVMGGCMMGRDPNNSVIDSLGRHHQLENLSVFDGSAFPTSIGANPQLSIYGLACKQATALAKQLGDRPPG